MASGRKAADTFLADHPEDYRGAMSSAVGAVRHEGLLGEADKEKVRELSAEIPRTGTLSTATPPVGS